MGLKRLLKKAIIPEYIYKEIIENSLEEGSVIKGYKQTIKEHFTEDDPITSSIYKKRRLGFPKHAVPKNLLFISIFYVVLCSSTLFRAPRRAHSMNTILKDRRMRKQISQEKAAEIIGVSLRSLRRYENGKSTPLLHSARNLALLYECSIEELFFPDEEGGKAE